MDQLENTDNSEDRNRNNGSKIDLTKNVLFPSPYKQLVILFPFILIYLYEQEFGLTNERFLVPEMMFRPADLGPYHSVSLTCISVLCSVEESASIIQHFFPFHVYQSVWKCSSMNLFIHKYEFGCQHLSYLWLTGLNQAGLAECIHRAISSCHSHLHPVLYERQCRIIGASQKLIY